MTTDARESVSHALVEDFAARFPHDVGRQLERFAVDMSVRLIEDWPPNVGATVIVTLRPDLAAGVLEKLSDGRCGAVLEIMDPSRSTPLLARLSPEARDRCLGTVAEGLADELRALMTYPRDSAGGVMDPNVLAFPPSTTVGNTLARIRAWKTGRIHYVFVIDADQRLVGAVALQDLAGADLTGTLDDLARPIPSVAGVASQEEVVETFEQSGLSALPVVDAEHRIIGVIRHAALVHAAEAEATLDIQTMVGVSREERALSPARLAIRKRLPWLNINLLTAFLASAVVALFEDTIARVTALAVLMPVVAGQSGNTGAQALAVTMRGLALREIRLRHWLRIATKELAVGTVNGIAIAVVTGLGVLVWSQSLGLAAVIGVAMVVSMMMAGLAGASVPMVLTVFGQDPAQASSIILTTVTDIVGFLSFLGLAALAVSFI